MADLFDLNDGGTTRPGTRAVVHPGAASGAHVVLYRVVAETGEHVTLDDGYTYDKRTGAVCGPAGRSTLQNRMAVTEGSAMFAAWSRIARAPHPQGAHSLLVRGASPLRSLAALLRLLGRR